jgi:hypothetical protein
VGKYNTVLTGLRMWRGEVKRLGVSQCYVDEFEDAITILELIGEKDENKNYHSNTSGPCPIFMLHGNVGDEGMDGPGRK